MGPYHDMAEASLSIWDAGLIAWCGTSLRIGSIKKRRIIDEHGEALHRRTADHVVLGGIDAK